MKRLGLALLAGMALSGAFVATAQEAGCPADYVCVEYKNSIIEIDPTLGFYQVFVVEERTLTVRDLDGERTRQQVKLAAFEQLPEGAGYALSQERIVERDGAYEDAELGDVFVLGEDD